jgi:cytidine deaminase
MAMEDTINETLIKAAKGVAKFHKATKDVSFGHVGCALLTDKGKIYTGVSIDAWCGIGFCAEHSAIASMLTNGEHRIKKIVSVNARNGAILPPCGRCREFMYQVTRDKGVIVLLGKGKEATLKELLPDQWQAYSFKD